ncbi:MAG: hypothetical protein QF735_09265, partial [Phycisphaeraceae bacterium]|nr:hypothetical protein [Phycisphaeraceae bacterium]
QSKRNASGTDGLIAGWKKTTYRPIPSVSRTVAVAAMNPGNRNNQMLWACPCSGQPTPPSRP